jgi:hypothetical protein
MGWYPPPPPSKYFPEGYHPPPAWGEVGGTSPHQSCRIPPAYLITGTPRFRPLTPAVSGEAAVMRLRTCVRHSRSSRGVGVPPPLLFFSWRGSTPPTCMGWGGGYPPCLTRPTGCGFSDFQTGNVLRRGPEARGGGPHSC